MNDLASAAVPGRPPRAIPAVRAALRRAAPALAAFAAVRLLGLVVLAVWSAADGKDWHTLLTARWDALWYTRVAEQGYGYTVRLPTGEVHSNLAFFPLLPWLERGLSALSPLSAADAGMVVSWLASLAAAWALYATGERLHGHRAGVALAALWAAVPVGIVQSMAYSESLFTALAAWSLYAVLTGRWAGAGVLASLAGLTRPVGAAVVAAVWITAAVTLWRQRSCGAGVRAALRARPGLLPGVLLAPLGWCGFFLWVGARQGSFTGYLDVQGEWGNGFDGGLAFGAFVWRQLSGPAFAAGLGLLVGVGLVVWLYLRGVRQGQPLPLAVYCGAVLLLALTAKGYFGSKPRLMLPAYPLLLPLAAGLARWRPVRAWAVVGLVAAGSAAYGAFWLNGSGPP
ncbi:glycosyltransferase family 39 protein [Streptomyces angustmyceticus]|uniref:Membrane protein n=1 Tax=Streptomyces angustmyceticus TaxID=285578 RepID=A0A5J4LG02_9ACTN|nr:glycosyltransferase family 39 protein [Streptomyces angustmyceticus]UAL69936.1 glycosyltransferase family 39 protein [Streptomyces angustmyceticus]GES33087.1 membrane protein [Streptomyces angustmyceticus]